MSDYTKSTNFATKDNLTPGDPLKIVRGTEIDTEFNNIATAIATKTDNASAAITGGSITGITDLAIADGGTGASTATAAINNLLPSQTSNANKYLQTDGTNVSWDAVSLSTSDITGTLPVANGGTGVTSSTGTGSVVLSNSPTLVTPALGTPASGVATNLTGLPLTTGVTGTLPIANGGTGQTTANAAFNALAPSQATASGKYLKSDGTNTSWDALDISTADITGTLPVANGGTGVTTSTGTGNVVLSNSPTLVTPALGTPSSATLTNATGLPISTGVSGLGTSVATALAVNVGSAGAPVVNGGALGTPSSGTVTNLTGTASININGTVGATTPTTGAFTTVAASSDVTLSGGTANGVTYLNGSKVLTSGSALTFDGTNLLTTGSINAGLGKFLAFSASAASASNYSIYGDASTTVLNGPTSGVVQFNIANSEQMRLTSTGLGIGTSSPSQKLAVAGNISVGATGNNGVQFHSGSPTGSNLEWWVANNQGASNELNFYYYSGGSFAGNAMSLTKTGNVGIGTSSPAQKLHVGGNQILQNTGSAIANNWIRWQNSSGTYQAGIASYFNVADTGNIEFLNGSTTNMMLSSAGNLGLGVTPSAWANSAVYRAFEIGAKGNSFYSASGETHFTTNCFFNTSGQNTYGANGFATEYQQASGQHRWYTAASGTAGNPISFTQAMTLDASGNLGVGTTSPSGRLDVIATNAGGTTYSYFQNNGASGVSASGIAFAQSGSIKSSIVAAVYGNDYMTFNVGSNTERARIDSSGNLLVGKTNSTGVNAGAVLTPSGGFNLTRTGTSASDQVIFYRGTAGSEVYVGTITTTGTATSYVTSSDYRLKNTISPMTGALAKVAQLKPVTYKWNADGSDGEGFIAHELAEVVPQCVTGEKDAVDEDGNPKYQGIDTSFLVATLTAALQELNAKFEAYVASHP